MRYCVVDGAVHLHRIFRNGSVAERSVDQFRANSGPILGWISLGFAEVRVMLRDADHA